MLVTLIDRHAVACYVNLGVISGRTQYKKGMPFIGIPFIERLSETLTILQLCSYLFAAALGFAAAVA